MVSTPEQVYEILQKEGIELTNKMSYSHPIKTKNKSIKLSLGRIWFNSILPDDFRLIDEPIPKNKLSDIFKEISIIYKPDEAVKYFKNIQKHANLLATFNPRTLSIEVFTPSQEWLDKKEKFKNSIDNLTSDEFNKNRDDLINELAQELKEKDVKFMEALDAKSSGKMNKPTFALLQISKGVTPDIENNLYMIKSAIGDGYTIDEYYKAAAEARLGFYIKKTAVRDPGYLSRKVAMSAAHIKLSEKDCKSKKTYDVLINDDSYEGRYFINKKGELELINKTDEVINKKISLRSPLYCKSKTGICSICYGRLSELANTDRLGILASGAVNIVGVNAAMKARHQAEKVKVISVNFSKIIEKSSVDSGLLNLLFNIKETEIYSKVDDLIVEINKNEYDDNTLIELHNRYEVPGLLNVMHKDSFISLPFNFDINLMKPELIETKGKSILLRYNKGDLVIEKDKYISGLSFSVISKILDGNVKYIKTPEQLTDMLKEEFGDGLDSVHIELIVSNMFRDRVNNKLPGRLTNYKDCVIIGNKQLSFTDSWHRGLLLENVNKSIVTGLVDDNEVKTELNDIEKLIIRDRFREDD